jgi:magnesium-protoporphyrin IX monomethyl ester (oxidative) cyclase
MTWKIIEEKIRSYNPDSIGVSALSTSQIPNVKHLLKRIKTIDNKIFTIVGGAHVSARPVEFVKSCLDCDLVVIGEGENKIIKVVKYLEGEIELDEIAGVCYNNNNSIKITENNYIKNIDDIPFPDYDLLEIDNYFTKTVFGKQYRKIPMITSRGCPFNCVFCSIHLHMGKKWRAHSPDYVIKHITQVVEKYDINHISFEDDNLTLDRNRFNSIMDRIMDNDISFTWDTPNGVRADRLTKDMLIKMKNTGCNKLTIAIESGNQRVLNDIIKKDLILDDVIYVANICKEVNIPLSAFYVVGFPGETLENMKETINFASYLNYEYDVSMYLMIATPLLETELYKICKENDYLVKDITPRILSEGTQKYGKGLIKTDEFTPEDVTRIVREGIKTYKLSSINKYYQNPDLLIKKMFNKRISLNTIYNYFNTITLKDSKLE